MSTQQQRRKPAESPTLPPSDAATSAPALTHLPSTPDGVVPEARTVHLVLQGKGGVGKSLVASLLAQHLLGKGRSMVCVDTDPVNRTFAGYDAFNARQLELLEGSKVNERNYDTMMEWLLSEDADFVVDSGATSFLPLSNYLLENGAVEMLAAAERQLVVHTVITGGQALIDTLSGFDQLAKQLPSSARIVVWLNSFFGPVEKDGKAFADMQVYQQHGHRIAQVLTIPKQSSDTFEKDMQLMLNNRLTFDEAIASTDFQLMAKQRLSLTKRALLTQLEAL